MNTVQLIIYDQLNINYLSSNTDNYIFLYSQKNAIWPYGTINLNPHSKVLEYAMTKAFVDDIKKNFPQKNSEWIMCDNYYDWLVIYCESQNISIIYIMKPSENYIYEHFVSIAKKLKEKNICIEFLPNTQFILDHEDFLAIYPDKLPVMENFYRMMRKRFDVLMVWDKPFWWKRNYDSENRSFDKSHIWHINHPKFNHKYLSQAQEFLGVDICDIDYPIDRKQALWLLDSFVDNHLDNFGRLEDAMYSDDGLVYHSLVSTSLNFWLLSPIEVINKISEADTDINNKEWFIRQILGWREYMYHFFHFYKEDIYQQNFNNYNTSLPYWFWEGGSDNLQMNCINKVLHQVKTSWYSHHITRLMIIGNFCLLAGIDPHDVNKRFWEMYVDAFEWVVSPNVLAMSQFSDGGRLATKPYISSANYINNMSNYCKTCIYDPKEKYWPNACPFNYLYRNFVDKNRNLFWRQPYIVSNLQKVDIDKIKTMSDTFIKKLTDS